MAIGAYSSASLLVYAFRPAGPAAMRWACSEEALPQAWQAMPWPALPGA